MPRHLQHRRARRGNVIVLSAVLMVGMMGVMAFAVDLGYLFNTRTELQRAADASAIAACWELIDYEAAEGGDRRAQLAASAKSKANQYAAYNLIAHSAAALSDSDVTVGYIAQPSNPASPFLTTGYTGLANAIRVRIRRTAEQNGVVPLFFAPVLGVNSGSLQTEATAAYIPGLNGFRAPSDGDTLGILPYALDQETWNGMIAGGGSDDYRFVDGSGVSSGPDGILEVDLFPQGIGSPGNRGTVDIGSGNNSTVDIARQILTGVTAADMANFAGSKLEFNSAGEMYLTGDTGISAAVKDQLADIVGQTRMIPIFSAVTGNGNNCTYTIVKWVGVRVMHVKLTGGTKHLMVQPAVHLTKGAITSTVSRSEFVFSPVWLVR